MPHAHDGPCQRRISAYLRVQAGQPPPSCQTRTPSRAVERGRESRSSKEREGRGDRIGCSEAFTVDDLRPDLEIFTLTDARALERWKRCEDGAADPCRILPIRRRDDAHSRMRRCEWLQLLLQARSKAVEERVAAGEDDMSIQTRA